MFRQKHIFLIAFACSLGLHLTSFGLYLEYARLNRLGQFSTRTKVASTQPATGPADELIVYPDMGDDQANGIGSNSSPGPEPLQAREADEDQALLSRNPQGAGRFDLPPAPQRGPVGNGKGPAPREATVTAAPIVAAPLITQTPIEPPKAVKTPAPSQAPPPVQVASAMSLPKAPDGQFETAQKPESVDRPPAPAPEPKPELETLKPTDQQTAPQVQPRQAPTPAKPQAADGDDKQRGVPPAAGNPLPQSESDSDPFSRISGNIIVPRVGRLDPRLGRKVKTTRPQVNIAGEIDLIALNNPTVVLEVHIARTGKVTDVKIAHSSGSNAIDEPTRVAVYDWWFEPAKDKTGKPVSDVTFFAVKFI
jgi:TonB family protein